MSLAKIIWAVSVLAAVVLAFMGDFAHGGMILAILGLASGWFLDTDHRRGVIIAAIFLGAVGAGSMTAIPAVGEYIAAIMGSLGTLFAAGSVMAILKTIGERLMPAKAAS